MHYNIVYNNSLSNYICYLPNKPSRFQPKFSKLNIIYVMQLYKQEPKKAEEQSSMMMNYKNLSNLPACVSTSQK
jgi:hypothetical protein